MGFLGCCGAIRESQCMLLLFFIIVLIVFIAEVAGAVVVLAFSSVARDLIQKLGDEAVKNIKQDYGKNSEVTTLWNETMTKLKCCGFYNYTDFTDSQFVNTTQRYPTPCCKNSTCTYNNATVSDVSGCLNSLVTFIKDNSVVLGAVGLGIAVLEVSDTHVITEIRRLSYGQLLLTAQALKYGQPLFLL
ncbi:TSN1 protein, partial [Amia calva]|nr:TSN1 protein [Amia calva]